MDEKKRNGMEMRRRDECRKLFMSFCSWSSESWEYWLRFTIIETL